MLRSLKITGGFLCFLAIGIMAFLLLRPDETQTTVELRMQYETPNSHYSNWRDIDLHYTDQGSGPAVIFIHGFAGSFTNWTHALDVFPEDYRLITVDLPGFGLSDPIEFTTEERKIDIYAEAIAHLMTELEISDVTLVGNSMGGYVSWETAAQYPNLVSSLILVNSAGYDMDDVGGKFINLSRTGVFDFAFKKGIPYRLSYIAAKNSVAEKPTRDEVKIFHDLVNRKETIQTLAALGASGEAVDTERISRIQQPCLIIWGELDEVIDVKHAHNFHQDISNSELVLYSEVAHAPQIENTNQFVEDVVAFLER